MLPTRWEGMVSAGKMTWLSSPTRSPTSSSHSPPTTRFQLLWLAAGGGKGNWEGSVAPLSLPASCPALGRHPQHLGVPCGLGAPSATLSAPGR